MVRTAVTNGVGAKTRRKSYARTSDLIELPRLIDIQLQSFEWFHTKGLKELFEEISPIVSFNKHLELHFGDFRFDEAKHTEEACRERDLTYSAPLWVQVKLVNKDTGEISEQEVFMGDFPLMTDSGTFIVNGSERVVVSQLIRSPGVYFTIEEDRSTGRDLTGTKLIPSRGAWLEFETSKRDIISVKVDRKRKLPVTILLRAIGYGTDEEIRTLFADVDDDEDHPFIEATLERDPTANPTEDQQKGIDDALLEFYKRIGFSINNEAEWRAGTMPIFSIQVGESKINVHPEGFTAGLRGPTAVPGCTDICFVWEGSLPDCQRMLEQAEVTIIEGPVPRAGGRGRGRAPSLSMYARDPDNNLLEWMIYE